MPPTVSVPARLRGDSGLCEQNQRIRGQAARPSRGGQPGYMHVEKPTAAALGADEVSDLQRILADVSQRISALQPAALMPAEPTQAGTIIALCQALRARANPLRIRVV